MEQKFTLTPSTYNAKDLIKRTEDVLTIIKLYTEDMVKLQDIADLYGVSIGTVFDILKSNDVKLRRRGRPSKCSQC